MQWSEFFSACQGQDESVGDYFIPCAQKATDCEFQCPQCSNNLSEYLLLKKLIVRLRDTTLRQQVYQSCDFITSVDVLRALCCSYEAARRDAMGGSP